MCYFPRCTCLYKEQAFGGLGAGGGLWRVTRCPLRAASHQHSHALLTRVHPIFSLFIGQNNLVCWQSNVCVHNPKISKMNRPLPSSKNPHFQNEV